jgi:uncharacterized protein
MNTETNHGYECVVDGYTYFFEPKSSGIYQSSGLLRDILNLAEELDGDDLARELSAKYDPQCVRYAITLLEKEGALGQGDEGAARHSMSESLGAKELYLQISHQCNLRCAYCYADGGHFGGPAAMMDEITAQKAVDFLLDSAGPEDMCSLNFDGGEPFLNFDLVRRMVDYAGGEAKKRDKKLSLNISSNGTLLTEENVRYLKSNRFSLGLSIDGDRSTHNLTRLTGDGAGSYDLLLSAIEQSQLFIQMPYAQARGTITRESLHCHATVKHLVDLGFKIIYLEPVGGANTTGSIDVCHMERLEREFKEIAALYTEELLNGNMLMLRNFFRPLEKIHSRSRFGFRCSAGVHTFAVSPGGEIYPCYKFVGMKDYVMGNIEDGLLDQTITRRFSGNHVNTKDSCRQCWARFLCGGGCPYLGASMHGDIAAVDLTDCNFTRLMCRLAVEIYIKLSQRNPKILDSMLGPRQKNIEVTDDR